ncbi:S8 family serine peptidase [uncultured Desulfosarcina sp.]|uniref:S8 family peptidase n=1 Tax=uncultured Desulfosarcina sp. TaxID=218289 RepID=UPI0029C9852A|nr:S8 family serine peptidase [uncultured Desulfosarcina sp.]
MKPTQMAAIALAFCLATIPLLVWASDPVVQIQEDRLTLDVNNQPLAAILEKLADQGIRIRIDPDINPRITARFNRRAIGSALSSILKSVDYALIWRKDKASAKDEPRLWEIRIFYRGQEARIRPLEERANLEIVKSDDAAYVKDVLLLRVTPGMTEADLAALLDQLGATLIDVYPPLGIVRIRLPHGSDVPAIAKKIAETEGIESAEPDYAYPLEGGRTVSDGSWPSASMETAIPASDATTVAVMDSGLSADYADNPFIRAAYDAVSPGAAVGDAMGHGTQMALIAAGAVNPLGVETDATAGSPVIAIRAFDDNGYTSTYTLVRGIDYAIENGARVLSLSWGSETDSSLLESATRYAASRGLVLVAAAGNSPTGDPVYPAAYENVIGVGALTPDGEAWDQSNYGDFVSVYSPGLADLPVGYNGDPGLYAGTSIATAYTARQVAAILSSNPQADQKTILEVLSREDEK